MLERLTKTEELKLRVLLLPHYTVFYLKKKIIKEN